ncbi:rhamnosyltransferase [Cupriavidus sp. TKC]|uniref:glycosyltransferase family 2 protein n=1 Tax=Cupriavidus sp. TKC TaxID=2880159 RepID=UPI0025A87718|nr:glycosyltransferase family 2 protein [Cupriavidus sp. TKC]GMG90989.1 rhamnosyltransferase [Cupriavidus sp. TKC]
MMSEASSSNRETRAVPEVVTMAVHEEAGAEESAISSVGAVVVTYNPDVLHLMRLLQALGPQVAQIVVVDNGSSVVPDISGGSFGAPVTLIECGGNLGIAAAHNKGLMRLKANGVSYGLLMDHDSLPLDGMVENLLSADKALRLEGVKLAAVGPVTIDRRTHARSKFVKIRGGIVGRVECAEGKRWVEADFLISSGTLIRLDVLADIGLMNEAYFIDHVDTEWCLRALNKGYRIFGICDALLDHSLGDHVVRVWFGRMREVPVHSPLRNYYIFRNTIAMLRDVPMPLGWQSAHLYRLLQFMVFFVIGIPPRGLRARLMMKGIGHGIAGRTGKL